MIRYTSNLAHVFAFLSSKRRVFSSTSFALPYARSNLNLVVLFISRKLYKCAYSLSFDVETMLISQMVIV